MASLLQHQRCTNEVTATQKNILGKQEISAARQQKADLIYLLVKPKNVQKYS